MVLRLIHNPKMTLMASVLSLLWPSSLLAANFASFSVIGWECREERCMVLVSLSNHTTQATSVDVLATLETSDGEKSPMEPFDLTNLGTNYFLIPGGTTISSSQKGREVSIQLPARKATKGQSVVVRIFFGRASKATPSAIELFPGGPVADISRFPSLPMLPTPRVSLGTFPEGVVLWLRKISRAQSIIADWPGDSHHFSRHGLSDALESLEPEGKGKVTLIVGEGGWEEGPLDAWVLVAVSLENLRSSPLALSLDRLKLVARPNSNFETVFALGGLVREDRQVFVDNYFSETLDLESKQAAQVVLAYKIDCWERELALTWR